MKKSVQIIIFFVTLTLFLFSFIQDTCAEYLIRPIPEEPIVNGQWLMVTDRPTTSNQQLVSDNRQLSTFNFQLSTYIPSITFGDLLASSSSSIEKGSSITSPDNNPQDNVSNRAKMIKELLAQLEASYQESLISYQQLLTHNTSTEFISSSLSLRAEGPSAVEGLSVNPQPITHNPQPNSPTPYIPIPTLIAGVSEIINNQQLNNQSFDNAQDKQLAINNQQSTNDLGALSENPKKTTYTIALLGDSMVDTLGKDLPHLTELLKQAYPGYSFTLLNYGQGGTDLESGLYRLTNSTNYLGTDYPPLLSYKPDILVIESFAYNHWGGHFYDLDRQWLSLAKIIDTVKENSPETKIILAATIAPNAQIFGDGVLNWPKELKWESANITRLYLQNLVNFATSQNYPLADAYHSSLDSAGNGLPQYTNQSDHLHPSEEGALLFSQKIVETIRRYGLIK